MRSYCHFETYLLYFISIHDNHPNMLSMGKHIRVAIGTHYVSKEIVSEQISKSTIAEQMVRHMTFTDTTL